MQMLLSRLAPQMTQNPQFMHLMQMLGGGLGMPATGGVKPPMAGPTPPMAGG
jgi:hypothetical protein